MPVSAGIFIREFDFTQYAKRLGLTALAIIGGASKGPMNEPTVIANEAELVRIFGKPLLTDYGLQAAVQYLQQGDNLVYVRVGHNAVQASYPVPGLTAGTAAVKAAGTVVFAGNNNPADGDYVTIAESIATASLQNDNLGALGNVAITKSGANIHVSGMVGGATAAFATGTIKLAAQPADANTVTISDGVTAVVFEFDSNSAVSGSNVPVVIGADAYATMTNLIAAITADAFDISATDVTVKKTFEFDSNSSYGVDSVPVLIGSTALDTMVNLISAISLQESTLGVAARNTTVTVPQATLTVDTAGADGNGAILKSGSNITVTGFTGGTDAVAGSVVTVLNAYALNAGSWGNAIQIVAAATQTLGAPSGNFDLRVYAPVDDGSSLSLVERFTNLSLDSASARYAPNIVTNGKRGEVSGSAYIQLDVLSVAGTVAPGTYALGTSPGTTGDDGIAGLVASDYIGSVSGQTATGLQTLRNAETTEFNILAIPGVSDTNVINAVLTVTARRGDFIYLVDPPFGMSRDEIIAWANGLDTVTPNAPGAALDSSYLALYNCWIQIQDAYSQQAVWVPPSGCVAAVYAYTDRTKGPGWAPAGHVRGKVNALKVEYTAGQDDRDLLVGYPNVVNPIVAFVEGGVQTITVFGNRTCQRALTSLNEIGVRRAFLYAEKLCATSTKVLVFDPNDSVTWRMFTNIVNEQLSPLQNGRNIGRFLVICDETTNPPAQIQDKTMRGKIIIEALNAAEIIEEDFAIAAPGGLLTVSQSF